MQGLFKHNSKNLRNSSRLLIVDDNVYLRKSLRRQFVTEGFHNIFDVGSLSGLNAVLKDANPDLILLDNQMPDSNGVDICKRLRGDGYTKSIVMLTAKDAETDITKCL